MPGNIQKKQPDYFICPNCGSEARVGASSCPDCGSDDRTGWSKEAETWSTEVPSGYGEDDSFDYEEFVQREFGEDSGAPPKLDFKQLFSCLLIVILIIALFLYLL